MQQVARQKDNETIWWALGLALMLHALAFTILSRLPPEQMAPPGAEGSIDVELVAHIPETPEPALPAVEVSPQATEQRREDPKPQPAATAGHPITEQATAAQPVARQPVGVQPSAAQSTSPAAGMIKAEKLYSQSILASPRSLQARKGLAQLAPEERVVQLCNLEAMEQVHRWKADFDPDFLVAYALGGVKFSGEALTAKGAAFRSKRQWWRIAYSCSVTADRQAVAGFAFKVGDAIPRAQWQDLGLAVADTAGN